MSEMPEKVRLVQDLGIDGFAYQVEDWDEDGTDYIRADLYEQAEAELAENESVINVWRGRAERAEADKMKAWENLQRTEFEFQEAEADRDRLRAAIEAALTMGISSDIYALIVSIRRRLQEALDHAG